MCNIDKKQVPAFPFKLLSAERAEAGPKTPEFKHRNYAVCTIEFVYEGGGFLETQGQIYQIEKDSIYFLYKHETHSYRHNPERPWKKLFIEVDGELMEELLKVYGLDQIHHIADCPQLRKFFESFMKLKYRLGGVDYQASAIFTSMLAETAWFVYGTDEDQFPIEILKLRKSLDNSIEKKFSLHKYAKVLNRSSAHMIREFRHYFQSSPYEYLMQKRIEEAKIFLRHTPFSIKEIAARLKFSDQYYFSNYFKRKTGISPRTYRQENIR